MYSIQKYVLRIMKEKRISKKELAKRLGYQNTSKGIRRFDSFISEDYYNKNFTGSLHLALEVPEEEIDSRLRETEQEIRKDIDEQKARKTDIERRSFVPYLLCHTERRIPSPIFICAIMGSDRLKIQKLPLNFNSLSPEEKTAIRKKLIEETVNRFERGIPAFGQITFFTQRLEYDDEEDEREVYDLNGDQILDPDEKIKKIYEGKATLTCKGQSITGLFGF